MLRNKGNKIRKGAYPKCFRKQCIPGLDEKCNKLLTEYVTTENTEIVDS